MNTEQIILDSNWTLLGIYRKEGVSYAVAVLGSRKGCNLYYFEEGVYTFVSGLKRNDGKDLTEEDILSHVAILLDNE